MEVVHGEGGGRPLGTLERRDVAVAFLLPLQVDCRSQYRGRLSVAHLLTMEASIDERHLKGQLLRRYPRPLGTYRQELTARLSPPVAMRKQIWGRVVYIGQQGLGKLPVPKTARYQRGLGKKADNPVGDGSNKLDQVRILPVQAPAALLLPLEGFGQSEGTKKRGTVSTASQGELADQDSRCIAVSRSELTR
jgi:hypothetical protein